MRPYRMFLDRKGSGFSGRGNARFRPASASAQEKNRRNDRRTSSTFPILRVQTPSATSEECIVKSLAVFASDILESRPPRTRRAGDAQHPGHR